MTDEQTSDSEQPKGDSEQPGLKVEDQPKGESKTYKVGDREMTADELHDFALKEDKDYKALQAEFTKGRQEAKKATAVPEPQDDGIDELEQVDELLKGRGYVKRDEIVTKDDLKLQSVLSRNPDLADKEQEIKDLANLPHNKGKAYEDIIAQYGFKSSDKLAKARASEQPVGDRPGEDKAPSIQNMSTEEWEKYKSEKGITGKTF